MRKFMYLLFIVLLFCAVTYGGCGGGHDDNFASPDSNESQPITDDTNPTGGREGTSDTTVNLSTLTSAYTAQDGEILTGRLVNSVRLSIADGATVTFRGVAIRTFEGNNHYRAGVTCEGDATIILQSSNVVQAPYMIYSSTHPDMYPAIYVPENKTLTIKGTGALLATSEGHGAGIGGGEGLNCGNIVIEGGTIMASSGSFQAGIGGGRDASCGNITITGGIIDTNCGMDAAVIGSGKNGSCGNITIANTVTKVTANSGSAYCSIGAGNGGSCGTINIGGNITGNITASPYVYNPTGYKDNNEIDLSLLLYSRTLKNNEVITGELNTVVPIKLSIAEGATVTLRDVVIKGEVVGDDNYTNNWAGITCEGNATIILEGSNSVRGFARDYPGIYVPEGSSLSIKGAGSLTARGNSLAAGIGGGDGLNCGNIIIESGTITATGGNCAAGIGGAYSANCGDIRIKGGTVTAKGGYAAAGIGSGYYKSSCGNITITHSVTKVTATKGGSAENSIGVGYYGQCGRVTIGGKVGPITESPYTYEGDPTADDSESLSTVDLDTLITYYTAQDGETLTGKLGANVKVSIADGATVTLDGVTITGEDNYKYKWAGLTCEGNATIIISGDNTLKGFYSDYPGIYVPWGKTLTIKGSGSLNASSNGWAAGIGGCLRLSCGNIVIEGGSITATGGKHAAGIGGGYWSSCGNITITSGTIIATGGLNATGIGGGHKASCGNITIANTVKKVIATKGEGAAYSIGAGLNSTCGTVTIGGKVTGSITTSPSIYQP